MPRHGSSIAFWAVLTAMLSVSLLAGCQQADDADDVEIPDFSVKKAPAGEAGKIEQASRSEIEQVAARSGPPRAGQLAFALKQGDRFPLQKTIEQTLAQQTKEGPTRHLSKLTMMFAITVDQEVAGKRLLTVRYQRVRYGHDLMGDIVEYDSQKPSEQIPEAALLYHGMVGHGFSFWLTPDNRIAELVGFDDFLKRCVRHVPAHKQKAVLTQMAGNAEDEGFANFVDDSIGLLRYRIDSKGRETDVKEGDEWQRNRKLMHPLPMALNTTYKLDELTDLVAKIGVFGTIVPIKAAQLSPNAQRPSDTEIVLKDGHSTGECTIDRVTGLPIKSRVERHLSLRVRLPDKSEFDQHKQIVTTVEAFPSTRTIYTSQNSESPIGAEPADGFVPAKHEVRQPAASDSARERAQEPTRRAPTFRE